MKTHLAFFDGLALKQGALILGTWILGSCVVVAGDPSGASSSGQETITQETQSGADQAQYRNWIDGAVGGIVVDGDRAGFQHRRNYVGDVFGGIQDFHWEQDVGKSLMQIDGHVLFDARDYLLKLDWSRPNFGYLRGGYRQFRTWYDSTGGFFPQNGPPSGFGGVVPENLHWIDLYNNEAFGIDRGEIWIEGALTLPDLPEIRLRYSHLFRHGKKDSTSWGDSSLTGGFGARGFVPTYLSIDETRDIFEVDIKHTLGNTDLGLGSRYERSENDNSRNIHRRPFEPTADRNVTYREGVDADIFNVHAFTETRFGEKVLVTTGYSFTTLDTDIFGSRIYGDDFDAVYDPLFARRQFHDEGFLKLSGGSQMNQHVANLSMLFTPWNWLSIVPALRAEKQDQRGFSSFVETDVGSPPALKSTQEELFNTRERNFTDVTESLELRFTGLPNVSVYARGEWLEGDGNLKEKETLLETGIPTVFRETDSTRFTQKYTVGAHWYPFRGVNFAAQYYYKSRKNDYDHILDSTPNGPPSDDRYPAFLREQDFATHDVNFRMSWRPFNNVTSVTGYDYQISNINTRADLLDKVESAETTTHIISETLTWTPLARLLLQGSVNYILDKTDTPAPKNTNAVLPSENDYWTASFMAVYALTDRTDLQGQYSYYRADNYVDNSRFGFPYGAGGEEHGVTMTLTQRFSKQMQLSLTYGFFSNHDQTSGGHNDYRAHLIYSQLHFLF